MRHQQHRFAGPSQTGPGDTHSALDDPFPVVIEIAAMEVIDRALCARV
jgi:hypothetical protein